MSDPNSFLNLGKNVNKNLKSDWKNFGVTLLSDKFGPASLHLGLV